MCNGAYSGTFTFRNNCEGGFSAALVSRKNKKSGVTAAKINSWVYRQTEPTGGILPACSLCNTPHKKT